MGLGFVATRHVIFNERAYIRPILTSFSSKDKVSPQGIYYHPDGAIIGRLGDGRIDKTGGATRKWTLNGKETSDEK